MRSTLSAASEPSAKAAPRRPMPSAVKSFQERSRVVTFGHGIWRIGTQQREGEEREDVEGEKGETCGGHSAAACA
jgi:hypothetical protein